LSPGPLDEFPELSVVSLETSTPVPDGNSLNDSGNVTFGELLAVSAEMRMLSNENANDLENSLLISLLLSVASLDDDTDDSSTLSVGSDDGLDEPLSVGTRSSLEIENAFLEGTTSEGTASMLSLVCRRTLDLFTRVVNFVGVVGSGEEMVSNDDPLFTTIVATAKRRSETLSNVTGRRNNYVQIGESTTSAANSDSYTIVGSDGE
jgi:hypothetical protein